ncbi:unnamed protein product [Zymoseptoria tritici ST99CH_1E4]|uniref:Uncharacterized protein n=1 Tax=Zymoseptoria tritici ST99CH_1E4 TaxID=1276532 RepID=A0A2H1FWE4_ZYMTR|nr:unnamed protein product [Zymoseptoria tritici ST99CH_1E4]
MSSANLDAIDAPEMNLPNKTTAYDVAALQPSQEASAARSEWENRNQGSPDYIQRMPYVGPQVANLQVATRPNLPPISHVTGPTPIEVPTNSKLPPLRMQPVSYYYTHQSDSISVFNAAFLAGEPVMEFKVETEDTQPPDPNRPLQPPDVDTAVTVQLMEKDPMVPNTYQQAIDSEYREQ